MLKSDKWISSGLEMLAEEFGSEQVSLAVDSVKRFEIEIPSWVFGLFGAGRFGDYAPPGAARNIVEKLDDASMVNRLTGATPTVAAHVLWDFSKDGVHPEMSIAEKVCEQAKERKISIGSVSPTYFLKGSFRGSMSAPEEDVMSGYIEQTVLAGEIANRYGGNVLTLWLPDGSFYPGQIELRDTYQRLKDSLKKAYDRISSEVKILIEYKVFEPGTYSTAISDWGTAFVLAKSLGGNVGVLIDLGHHYHGKNIEQIVAMLISENMCGGFHFNSRYAADDDHVVEPNAENARIFYELVKGDVIFPKDGFRKWEFMIDQCSPRENRIQSIIHSVDSLQLSLAKAILVNRQELEKWQKKDGIIEANRIFSDALMNSDVRPIVAKARQNKGLSDDPLEAYIKSGYQKKIERERE